MRIIKIKNLQASSDTYCGQTIGASEYYQIQSETEREVFANDIKVQNHMSSDPQKILVNDGTNDLDYLEGKQWLEGTYIQQVMDQTIASYEKFFGAEVEAGGDESEQAWTIVPANGKKLTIKEFDVIGPVDRNSYVALIWCYDHETEDEVELYFGKGGERFRPLDMSVTGDGVKELAIVLINTADLGSVRLAGELKYDLED